MAFDLAYYRAAVKRRLGVPDEDGWNGDADLDPDINEALRLLSAEADWPWLEVVTTHSVTATVGEITLPDDYRRTINLRVQGKDEPLDFQPIGWLERLSDASGTPRFYGFFGRKLIIRPIAGTTMTLSHRYKAKEAVLAVAANVPLLSDEYSGALVEGATVLAARRNANQTVAAKAQTAYDHWVSVMKGETGLDSPSEGGGITPLVGK